MDKIFARIATPCLLALLAACAPARPGAAPGAGLVPDATPLAGRWVGTYTCAQGQTGLTLTLSAGTMGQLDARFEFYPVPGNPSVPSGAYRMMGWLTTDGHLALVGVEWIRRPPDYVMVGLSGRLAGGGRVLEGTVPECAAPFSLERR